MGQIKAFNIRMPRELWAFLKNQSVELEKPMNVIIIGTLQKEMKKRLQKKLKDDDTMVS